MSVHNIQDLLFSAQPLAILSTLRLGTEKNPGGSVAKGTMKQESWYERGKSAT